MKKIVVVNDKMQKNYKYELSKKIASNFHYDFKPELNPKEKAKVNKTQLLDKGFNFNYHTNIA